MFITLDEQIVSIIYNGWAYRKKVWDVVEPSIKNLFSQIVKILVTSQRKKNIETIQNSTGAKWCSLPLKSGFCSYSIFWSEHKENYISSIFNTTCCYHSIQLFSLIGYCVE